MDNKNHEKDTANPKDAIGSMKVSMHYVPLPIKYELGLAMMEGGRKYGDHNYRASGVRASVYYDACNRHLDSFWEGEDTDPDSGLPHLAKAMACLGIIRDSQLMGNWIDDRPEQLPDGLDMKRLNALAAELVKKFPDVVAPYTQVRKAAVREEMALSEPKLWLHNDASRYKFKKTMQDMSHQATLNAFVAKAKAEKEKGHCGADISCKHCCKVIDCSVSSSETRVCMDFAPMASGGYTSAEEGTL